MNRLEICSWNDLEDRIPKYALIDDLDLVIIRYDEEVSVLYGRFVDQF